MNASLRIVLHAKRAAFVLTVLVLVCFDWAGATYAIAEQLNIEENFGQSAAIALTDDEYRLLVNKLRSGRVFESVRIRQPPHQAVIPRDLAPPLFQWVEGHPDVDFWLLEFALPRGVPIRVLSDASAWVPSQSLWSRIIVNSVGQSVSLTVRGVDAERDAVVSQDAVDFSISQDPVEGAILYRLVPPVFSDAMNRLPEVEYRLADPASASSPRVVLKGSVNCVNCHSASRDGSVFGMDLDMKGDKGGYVLTRARSDMRLEGKDVISWNDFVRTVDGQSSGLFARVSPSGRYVAATVDESILLIKTEDPYFSQLFFPMRGVLAVFDRLRNEFKTLAGADHLELVQTCPDFSPDERRLVFARTTVNGELIKKVGNTTVFEDASGAPDSLNAAYPVQFDLYVLPFAEGDGGVATPLLGASGNGFSNYYPRHSPDGRWLVFTRSGSGLVIQPDSRLMIMPSGGGVAKEMRCNREFMNSWHSWSSNGHWIVFASKADGPETSLYLAHVDALGRDAPPVLLHRLSVPGFAANIPEFVNNEMRRLTRISLPPE